jgi:hypothetical protein
MFPSNLPGLCFFYKSKTAKVGNPCSPGSDLFAANKTNQRKSKSLHELFVRLKSVRAVVMVSNLTKVGDYVDNSQPKFQDAASSRLL